MIDSPSRPDPENLCTHLLAPGQAGLQPSIGQSPGSQKSLVGALPLCARLLHPILFSQTEVGHTRSFFSFTRFQFGYGTPFELWIAIVKENLCLFCTHKIKFGVFSSCSKIEHSRGVWMISIKVSRTSSWILITTQFHEIPHDETERETKFWIRGLCSVRTLVLRGKSQIAELEEVGSKISAIFLGKFLHCWKLSRNVQNVRGGNGLHRWRGFAYEILCRAAGSSKEGATGEKDLIGCRYCQ